MVPLSHYCWVWVQCANFLVTNNNALTAAFSLAFLEIRSRNEEAINSTRNRIYSLKVFYFLLYRYRNFTLFPKLSSQNMFGFDHKMILSSSFHGLHKECLAQWPPICVYYSTMKNPMGYFQKNWVGCVAHLLKLLPYFRPKSVIFSTLFQTWSPVAWCMSGARDKLLGHVHGWGKH